MKKLMVSMTMAVFCVAPVASTAANELATVPKPFQGFDPGSTYKIKYDDVNALLKLTVIKTGRSTREVAAPTQASTGTRMKQTVKRATAHEGNRFYYELFNKDEDSAAYLHYLRKSLEAVPNQVPLELFSRDEQLAYWLNLYNIVLIDEIVQIYPKRNLKKYVRGKKSILDKKTMSLSGVSLSLNDIENTILAQNYDHNPLVLYGLYQGIIGGPNIRKVAYRGDSVFAALQDNAEEFVNSNRGTYSKDERTFRVSSYYDRNMEWFDGSDENLKAHLEKLVDTPELNELVASSRIKADINDWSVTDLYGSNRDFGGSMADSNAALLDSVQGVDEFRDAATGEVSLVSTNFSASSSAAMSKAAADMRFNAELVIHLQEINARRNESAKGDATVTVEELGEVDVAPENDDKKDKQ